MIPKKEPCKDIHKGVCQACGKKVKANTDHFCALTGHPRSKRSDPEWDDDDTYVWKT